MLCIIVAVFTLTGPCRGASDNSLPLPLPPPAPTVSQRMSQAQVASLRRQLMRDNYDYEHSDDGGRQPNVTERSAANFSNPQGGADHLQRASELDQANVKSFSAELDQLDQYERQDRQHQQGEKHDQPVRHERRRHRGLAHPHQQHGNNENRGQSDQPTGHEEPDQFEQRSRKQQYHIQQLSQNERLGKYKHRAPNKQPGEYEQHSKHRLRGQLEQPGKHKHRYQYKRGSHGLRGQNTQRRLYRELGICQECRQNDQQELGEPQEQLDRFDEQEPSKERTDRAAPPLADAPHASSDELTGRDEHEREHPPARHAAHPDWPVEYYNKRRDSDDAEPKHLRRPFDGLRSNYKELSLRANADDDQQAQEEQAPENDAQLPEQELSPDDREAFDRLEVSGSENEGSDISESQKQPDARYNEFEPESRQYSRATRSSRANRLQYYTPPPTRKPRPPRVHIPLTYQDYDSPTMYDSNVPQEPQLKAKPYRHRAAPPGRYRNAARDPEKDLLYYMDDKKLRRRNNNMSPDVPNDDQTTGDEPLSPQPTARSLHNTTTVSSRSGPIASRMNPVGSRASPTVSRLSPVRPHSKPARRPGTPAPADFLRTKRARSFVVTVSPNNVTYKLLSLKSREGRRRGQRRLLEERGPGGVAILSLDHAPPPAFRLPRARRQYMHDHHRYGHKPA